MESDIEKSFNDYHAAWSSRDVEKMASLYTDDCVYEDMASGAVSRGKQELKAFITATFVVFPDLRFERKSESSSSHWAASEWVMSDTHAGEFGGIPATGKTFSMRAASILELHEGKIRRQTDYSNGVSFLQQVGLMPVTTPNWVGRLIMQLLIKRQHH